MTKRQGELLLICRGLYSGPRLERQIQFGKRVPAMTEDELEQFHDGLTRCTGNPLFIERFYELFLSSSEAVREKFKDTDFKKQRRSCRARST